MNRILIVNDFWPLLKRVREKLLRKGYDVLTLRGEDLRLSREVPYPDQILAVMLGDDASTEETLRVIRSRQKDPVLATLPVVVVGGFNVVARVESLYRSGADEVIPADFSLEELCARIEPHLRLRKAYLELLRVNERLKELSMTDDLTGLPNRRWFQRDIRKGVEMARRLGTPISCIMVDIDDFKEINDQFGHRVGDMVLVKFGNAMGETKRAYDVVARLGGDEFGWILFDADSRSALNAAMRTKNRITSHPFRVFDHLINVTASFGIATCEGDSLESHGDLIERADRALYVAKERGKNRVVVMNEKGEPREEGHIEIS
ncbi:MAG: diguanylate cyclase [Deltaproteobacteria bacterium]|nr:MAG: diguanylate cyclase [Deltaproteobacteria bacterium]